MALADYRLCNVCGCKAFYDACLEYTEDKPRAQNGEELPDGAVADLVCLCAACAETHRIAIVENW